MSLPAHRSNQVRSSVLGSSPLKLKQMLSRPSLITVSSNKKLTKEDRLKNFNAMHKDMKMKGVIHNLDVHDSHLALQKKEIL